MNGAHFGANTLRKVLLLYFFLLQVSLGKSQQNSYYFHQLTAEQGLINQRFNFFIHRDQTGHIWIPSLAGLNRYNGQTVRQFLPNEKDSTQLTDGLLLSRLFEDDQGTIRFNTAKALHTYIPEKDYFKKNFLDFKTSSIKGRWELLHVDTEQQECWILTDSKLWVYPLDKPGSKKFIQSIPNQFGDGIRLIPVPNSDLKYLLVPKIDGWEVHVFRQKERIKHHIFPIQPDTRFKTYSFFLESKNRLWVGTDTGLVLVSLNQKKLEIFNQHKKKTVDHIRGIEATSNGQLIIASADKGLYLFDSKNKEFSSEILKYDRGNTKSFQLNIDQIYLDIDENLWVSTSSQGVFFTNLNKRKFSSFLQNPSEQNNKFNDVKAIATDDLNNIWSINQHGLKIISPKGEEAISFEGFQQTLSTFPSGRSFFLFRDQSKQTWACGNYGLYFNSGDGQWQPTIRATADGKPITFLYGYQLRNGRTLFSTYNKGVFEARVDRQGINLKRPISLPDTTGTFPLIYESPQSQVFISKELSSILVFQQQDRKLKIQDTIPLSHMVHALLADRAGTRLWIGTSAGLYWVDTQDADLQLNKDETFPSQAVVSILQDTLGNLWTGTNNGLIKYNHQDSTFQTFGLADGIQANEFNFYAAIRTKDGNFIFGGNNGINVFNPYLIDTIPVEANPIITEILINDSNTPNGLHCLETQATNPNFIQHISLPNKQNTLSFRFAALEYSNPESNQFRYKLEGIDKEWVLSETRNFARYPNLDHGNYTFHLQATNSDGKWAESIKKLQITIQPAWHQRTFVRVLFGLGLLFLVYQAYRFRVKQVRKQEAILRREAEHKQELAELKQKEAEYKLKAAETETAILRLQMNPHFIFNSLNSINSYILHKDVNTASQYLSRFSKLMRKILELAKEPFIELQDEIDFLKQYLLTENMRLERKFTFDISCDDTIDPEEILIPTMILQPFLENAIWHGIAPMNEPGIIRVRFERKEGSFHCSVEDNGIGVNQAQRQKETVKNHTSKAISITKHRLRLLAAQTGEEATYQIFDLSGRQNQTSGTKVLLILPFL